MKSAETFELIVDDEHFVHVAEVERCECAWEYEGAIFMRSGPFAIDGLKFYFEGPAKFLAECRALYDSLEGTAVLGHPYELNRIAIKGTGLGHILVSGYFQGTYEYAQELTLEFTADQTFLFNFIAGLERVCDALGA